VLLSPDKKENVNPYESWAAIVALKPAAVGKSRLAALPDPLRRRLAVQMALDALTALAATTSHLVVVSDSSTIRRRLQLAGIAADVIADPKPGGLNNALRAGEATVRDAGARRVLACVGDLPALTASAVATVISTMGRIPADRPRRGFVADRDGTGSTMLLADGVPLDPHFGRGSAAAHRSSGAVELNHLADGAVAERSHDNDPDGDIARARTDVDDPDDLPRAIAIGVGTNTASLISNNRLADYTVVTITGINDAMGFTGRSESGQEFAFSDVELDASIGRPAVGDRLHAAVADDHVISLWAR
jgi:2-phospho-L-lactate guanylyltransferase